MAREIFRRILSNGNLLVSSVSEIEDGDFSVNQSVDKALEKNQFRLHAGEWNWLSQEHGTEIVWLADHERALGVKGDALITASKQKVIAITVADCLPLLLIDESGIIGLLHLGWRGIEQGLLEKAIQVIRKESVQPLSAVLGPCINVCCYEFGRNEMDILVEKYGKKIIGRTLMGALSLDIKACVKKILKSYEVGIEYEDASCTNCDPRHWSFRADGTDKRQVMIAWKQESE